MDQPLALSNYKPIKIMTKQHFEFVAQLISQVKDLENRNQLACEASARFSYENQRFDEQRFMAACKVDFFLAPI